MTKKLKEKAFSIIEEHIKKKDYKELSFLYSTTLYLKSKPDEFKKHIKYIKKALKETEKEFDDTYLLLFEKKDSKKVFTFIKNSMFLRFADDLIYILSNNEFTKESDKLMQIKSKIEIGFERYFKHGKITVHEFSDYEFRHSFNEEDKLEISMIVKLINILIMKEEKKKNFKKKFDELKPYLEDFPKEIYTKDTIHVLEIYKSLFSSKNLEIKNLKKNNEVVVVLKDLNNIDCVNLTYQILE